MIKIIKGNLFRTTAPIIAHQVNCQGVMGSGVARQVRELYPQVYDLYRKKCKDVTFRDKLLGYCQLIPVSEKRSIANLFAQENYGYDGRCYTSLAALHTALSSLAEYAAANKLTVAMPYKIGCVRGGADWDEVYQMIDEVFRGRTSVELWRLA